MSEQEKNHKLWKERIKSYETSGLTIKAWCEANQIKEHQLHYWRRKIKSIPKQASHDESIKINIGPINLEIKNGFDPTLLKEVMKVLMEVC